MGCGASSSSTEASSAAQAKPEDKKSQAAENQAASQVDGQALPMLTGKPMPAIGLGTWQVKHSIIKYLPRVGQLFINPLSLNFRSIFIIFSI